MDFFRKAYRWIDRQYKRGYNAVFFSCQHMSHLASQQLDRSLTPREQVTRWIHLRLCTWCRRYERQLRFLRERFRHYGAAYPEQGSETLPEDARRRMLKKISEISDDSL